MVSKQGIIQLTIASVVAVGAIIVGGVWLFQNGKVWSARRKSELAKYLFLAKIYKDLEESKINELPRGVTLNITTEKPNESHTYIEHVGVGGI